MLSNNLGLGSPDLASPDGVFVFIVVPFLPLLACGQHVSPPLFYVVASLVPC